MRKAVLLFNPSSGGGHSQRRAQVDAVVKVLQDAGIEVSASPTGSSAGAVEQARQAVASGCEAVFACGGDGTVHDVIQGLAGTETALAVIPLGTANALAHELGLPLDPVAAAYSACTAQARRVALGRINYLSFEGVPSSRYFTVAGGVGIDAQLFYNLHGGVKRHLGMTAYYAQAIWLWLTQRVEFFQVSLSIAGSLDDTRSVSELLAVRIARFGGVLNELAQGASLSQSDLRLVLFETGSRLRYLSYVVKCMLGRQWNIPGVVVCSATRAVCYASTRGSPARIYVEADGELLGTLPAEISMVPDALTILVPLARDG